MESTENATNPTRFWSWIAGFKLYFLFFCMAGLLASNVASLVSDSFHGLLYDGLRKVLSVGGGAIADNLLRKSPTVQIHEKVRVRTASLQDENIKLSLGNRDLKNNLDSTKADLGSTKSKLSSTELDLNSTKATLNSAKVDLDTTKASLKKSTVELEAAKAESTALTVKNQKLSADVQGLTVKHRKALETIDVHGKSAKSIASSVQKRLAKGVVRNTAAIPAESIPYIGIGVTLSVTALDIYDACETMKEINSLMRMMGQGQENADLCGTKVPTTQEVLSKVKTQWKTSAQQVAAQAKAIPASVKIPVPEVRLPTKEEAASGICSGVDIPGLC